MWSYLENIMLDDKPTSWRRARKKCASKAICPHEVFHRLHLDYGIDGCKSIVLKKRITLLWTNIAMENPPFWCYLPGKMWIFMGYVSFTEGIGIDLQQIFNIRMTMLQFVRIPMIPMIPSVDFSYKSQALASLNHRLCVCVVHNPSRVHKTRKQQCKIDMLCVYPFLHQSI